MDAILNGHAVLSVGGNFIVKIKNGQPLSIEGLAR